MICRWCHCPITAFTDRGTVVYVVDDGGTTTADGLTYCPPDPDHQGKFRDHQPMRGVGDVRSV